MTEANQTLSISPGTVIGSNHVEEAIKQPEADRLECIELLSVNLLQENPALVKELKGLADSLGLEFGWHYLLDLTWIIVRLQNYLNGKTLKEMKIIDAGAGTGILQWYLAEHGAQVISVDRLSRASLPIHFRRRYQVTGLRPNDLVTTPKLLQMDLMGQTSNDTVIGVKARFCRLLDDFLSMLKPKKSQIKPGEMGNVTIYNQDLTDLEDISDNSIDVILSISALEHNSPEGLEKVVQELLRVLKPGAPLAATLTAAKKQDFWHTPSHGWSFSVKSLSKHFNMPEISIVNQDDYDRLFDEIHNCVELRNNLARFYFLSGENGMPWGIWDPQYIPVGVWKIKPVIKQYSGH